ncbi:MAG: diaminopimelate epimerase [Gammaproteobacteria bacterium]|nr:diaminopimelate epimerase [Gammaproteobacteria bacterium]
MQIRFTKMHGLGNDFVVLDSLSQEVHINAGAVRRIADRHRGVGCDQLLLIEPPADPDIDFNYRIFNADGSEVEQCGNGARCLARYVVDKRLTGKRQFRVATSNSVMQIDVQQGDTVRVDMGEPVLTPAGIPFEAEGQSASYELQHELGSDEISAVSMGNPHAVLLVDDIETAPVQSKGPVIERHTRFPARVNVGFMQLVNRESIKLRVFERGVGETQACGTGACAAVVAGQLRGLLEPVVTVHLRGGELRIEWQGSQHSVFMTGEAIKIFDGKMRL